MAEEQANDLNLRSEEQIGDYLRRIREARGLEIEQVAKAICLQKNILLAIEENRWEEFPTEAYLRSYISSICEKLSIDKMAVLKKFSADRNSQFAIAQITLSEEKKKNSKPLNNSTVGIIVVLAIIAVLFFANKFLDTPLNKEPASETSSNPAAVDAMEEDEKSAADTLAQSDTTVPPAISQADTVASKPARAQDTLRFECANSSFPAKDYCIGITLKGVDKETKYYHKTTTRIVNHNDTSQVTITVPERTRILVNGEKIEHGKFNTILFLNGKIVQRKNRELR